MLREARPNRMSDTELVEIERRIVRNTGTEISIKIAEKLLEHIAYLEQNYEKKNTISKREIHSGEVSKRNI